MQTYRIEGRKSSPEVFIDKVKSTIQITGNSTLRETHWFYGNLLKWMLAFNQGDNKTRTVNIHLERLNDSSLKWLILIFRRFSLLFPSNQMVINWFYTERNVRLEKNGLALQSSSGIKVNLITA